MNHKQTQATFDFRTLETGHSIRSRRREVSRHVIKTLAPVVCKGQGEVAGLEVRFIEWSDGADAVFDVHVPGVGRIARCYLGYDAPEVMREKVRADHSNEGADSLSGRFLAVSLFHGFDLLLSEQAETPKVLKAVSMAGDFERSLAWTLIAGHRPTRH
jgi:hypothetical protein